MRASGSTRKPKIGSAKWKQMTKAMRKAISAFRQTPAQLDQMIEQRHLLLADVLVLGRVGVGGLVHGLVACSSARVSPAEAAVVSPASSAAAP